MRVFLDTNAGYVTDATLTVTGANYKQVLPLVRAMRPWQATATWRTPAAMQPYTLTAQFTAFDGTAVTADPLSIDVVPPGTIAYVEAPVDGGMPAVYVVQTDSSNRELWAENATDPAWGSDGALYFVRDNAVWRQTSADAPAEPLAGTQVGVETFSLGNPVALVDDRGRLLLQNADGTVVQPQLDVGTVKGTAWHPNGEELLLAAKQDGSVNLYRWPLASTALEPVVTHPVSGTQPAWRPDGAEIVFTSSTTETTQIKWLSLTPQSERPSIITDVPFGAEQASWSPDGSWIVYVGQNTPSPASREIVLQRVHDDPYAVQITRTDAAVYSPAWRMP